MATSDLQDTIELKIWERAIAADDGDLQPDVAKAVLGIKFSEADQLRAHELARKNQDGTITADEKSELNAFGHVGLIISILWSKARRSLKRAGQSHNPAA